MKNYADLKQIFIPKFMPLGRSKFYPFALLGAYGEPGEWESLGQLYPGDSEPHLEPMVENQWDISVMLPRPVPILS